MSCIEVRAESNFVFLFIFFFWETQILFMSMSRTRKRRMPNDVLSTITFQFCKLASQLNI